MKAMRWAGLGWLAAHLVWTGCSGGEKPDKQVGAEVTTIDATKFRPSFESASAAVKAAVEKVMMSIQGSDFQGALASLEKLASDSTLTEQQKKAVKDLTDQMQKKIASMVPKVPG